MGTSTSAAQKPNTNLAKTNDAAIRINGASRNAQEITDRLQYAAKHFHLVSPMTSCAAIPEGCSIALSTIIVDAENETYDVGGKLGLAKAALDKIAAAAGISWDARMSGRLDDGSDPYYVSWRAVGQLRHLDGTLVQLLGTKEMDLRPDSAQLEALWDRFRSKHEAWTRNKKGYEPKSPEGQIREMRLHIVGHAESKARLRAIRSLGIRSAYKAEELRKPFVVAKLMWTGQSDDPELARAFAMKQADAMLGGLSAMYGNGPVAAPPVTVMPSAAGMPALGGRRPPPPSQTHDHDDEDAIDVPAKPPSEPRRAAKQAPPPPDSAPASGPGEAASGPLCRFGKTKDMPLTEMSDKDLKWYREAIEANVADPEKGRFKASNEAHLKEVLAEVARREGGEPEQNEEHEFDRGDNADAY